MKYPSFGLESDGQALRCKDHKDPGMVRLLVNKRCGVDGCMKHPSFGLESDGKVLRCNDHKEPDMVRVFGKRSKSVNKSEALKRANDTVRFFAKRQKMR
jgi:hypothetical protein